jgi:hypothetical protein
MSVKRRFCFGLNRILGWVVLLWKTGLLDEYDLSPPAEESQSWSKKIKKGHTVLRRWGLPVVILVEWAWAVGASPRVQQEVDTVGGYKIYWAAIYHDNNLFGTWRRRVLFSPSSTFQSMAGLECLVPYIYHEKQQEGSMLCAQHALNSLLRMSQSLFIHRFTCCLYIFLRGQLCASLDNLNICSPSDAEY